MICYLSGPAQLEAPPPCRIQVPELSPTNWQAFFDPFVTTKAKRTGLGLAICETAAWCDLPRQLHLKGWERPPSCNWDGLTRRKLLPVAASPASPNCFTCWKTILSLQEGWKRGPSSPKAQPDQHSAIILRLLPHVDLAPGHLTARAKDLECLLLSGPLSVGVDCLKTSGTVTISTNGA